MTTLPSWINAAAEELCQDLEIRRRGAIAADDEDLAHRLEREIKARCAVAVEIIRKHCPMKDGVAYMPVPRCETCRHWSREDFGTRLMPLHACALTEVLTDDNDSLKPTHHDARALVTVGGADSTGLVGWLITKPEFGCVEHEPREGG